MNLKKLNLAKIHLSMNLIQNIINIPEYIEVLNCDFNKLVRTDNFPFNLIYLDYPPPPHSIFTY